MLADFVSAFAVKLAERGADRVKVTIQRRGLFEADDATVGRVVFVPTTDPIKPPMRVGGNPRDRRDRMAGADIHVWSPSLPSNSDVENFANAEALVHAVINAWLDVSVGTFAEMSDGRWDDRSTTLSTAGFLWVLPMQANVPVVDVKYAVSAADTAMDLADRFVNPDGSATTNAPSCTTP